MMVAPGDWDPTPNWDPEPEERSRSLHPLLLYLIVFIIFHHLHLKHVGLLFSPAILSPYNIVELDTPVLRKISLETG